MALTYAELDAITNDWFMVKNGVAVDIYFKTSFLLNYLMKQMKGIWERPAGGRKIRIPLEYDGQEAGFFHKGETLSSDDRESMNAAFFLWKNAYGNATLYTVDEMENESEEGEVSIALQRVKGAQKSITKLLAGAIYDGPTGSSDRLTGLLACCNETSTLAYGGIAEDDLVAADGTKPWQGKLTSTTESLSEDVIKTLMSSAKLYDGPDGKPNLIVTTETLFNIITGRLEVMQRFTQSDTVVKAGFNGVEFAGASLFPDDFCPSGYLFALNTNHIGFACHKKMYFSRTPWHVIPDSPEDKTMKILWRGNMVVNNRQAHAGHSNLS